MSIAQAGLARITVTVLDRRVDLAVPDDVPLAELLPDVVRHADDGFGRLGAEHGGWIPRRGDGTALSGAKTLKAQGVRDGHALVIALADVAWPEPEYDDVVEAIAATGRLGLPWNPAASRWAAVVTGALALIAGAVALASANAQLVPAIGLASALAAVLLGGAAIATRTLREPRVGVACGVAAMVYAFVAGTLAGGSGSDRLLGGSFGMGLAGLAALAIVGTVSPLLVAGTTSGLVGIGGALLTTVAPPSATAAVVLAVTALGTGLVPAAAIRLGGLARGEVDRLAVAVTRTDQWIVGLHLGGALAAGAAATVVLVGGNAWSWALVGVSAGALGLRCRAYAAIRQRLAVLLAGVAAGLPLVGAAVWTGPHQIALAGGFAAAGLLIMVWTAVTDRAPYVARAGDAAEVICLAAVLPLLCGALGLYTKLRGLS